MSTINEALKKAQKERDRRQPFYTAILSKGGGRQASFNKRHLSWFVIIAILLIAGTLASDAWLDKRHSPPQVAETGKYKKTLMIESPTADDKKNRDRLYERAKNFHGQGRLKLAEKFYLEALKIDPNHTNAINNLGVIFLMEQNFARAEELFVRALTLDPGSVDPYYNLACLYALKGDNRQGIDFLKKAIQLDQTVLDWAQKDGDLDNLRGTPEFEVLMNRNQNTAAMQER